MHKSDQRTEGGAVLFPIDQVTQRRQYRALFTVEHMSTSGGIFIGCGVGSSISLMLHDSSNSPHDRKRDFGVQQDPLAPAIDHCKDERGKRDIDCG